ncbi:Cytochrome c family protein [Desulfamplus magnetovallimortis]|uniref:Cytochrome c family protein n=1 Tax=Desulfamplus magnetovallimortis TaxID=1246637 RepID=A0A1W1H928_9BACT|nr:cytochrome c family protein [Desulfamplus magnetovallimortis]SLM28868.1 Cytochrome c family protein [Desulfamplus magnetovallimortis]
MKLCIFKCCSTRQIDLEGKIRRDYENYLSILFLVLTFLGLIYPASGDDKTFVGSKICSECHEEQHTHFENYAKKATSYESIAVMRSKLTESEFESCFECHTTGYGKPGGFISETETPELKNAGCEVCHGPGSVHVESQDPEDIITELSIEDCNHCHSEDRVDAFDFKPLLFGGAH